MSVTFSSCVALKCINGNNYSLPLRNNVYVDTKILAGLLLITVTLKCSNATCTEYSFPTANLSINVIISIVNNV